MRGRSQWRMRPRATERVLVCDNDPLATVVWSEVLYGEAPAQLRAHALASRTR